jgi:hypothetical protein
MGIAPFVAALSRRLGTPLSPSGPAAGGSYPVTFPATILRIRVELLLGGVWVNITPYVQYDPGIAIIRGRTSSQRRARISQCTLKLRNDSRRFSPRNVAGPYFGLLRRNTPVRVWADPGSGDSLRFSGRVPSWKPFIRTAPNARDVTIIAYGRRNQMERGEDVLESAQYRYLSTAGALQYRPMEGTGENTVPGPPGSGNLPDLSGGGVWSDFPGSAPASSWRMEVDARFALGEGTADFAPIIRWNTGGTIGEWKLSADVAQAQLTYTVQATGASTILDTGLDVYDGLWHHWQVDATQNGANIDLVIRADGASVYSTSIATHTLGSVGFWLVQDDSTTAAASRMPAVGHVVFYGPIPSSSSSYDAFTGWAGETPAERFARLCAENGIPYVVRELVVDGELMGPQTRSTLTDLLDETEATSEGVIDEDFANNLRLTSRTGLWNQAVALALNYAALPSQMEGELTPSDDDELTRNWWSISRDGSDDPAAVARLESGPLNINDPEDDPLGITPVKDADTLSLYSAAQAAQHAAYRVARDTVDRPRFPSVKINLANAPSLIPQWLACDVGSRATIANPPTDVGVDAPDTIIAGYTETLNQISWLVDAFLDDGTIYRQTLYDASPSTLATAARYDCRGSTLATALVSATGAGTVDVAITDTCAWAHDTGDYDIMIDAEAITVTAIGAVGGTYPARTQTLTVVRASNGVQAAHAVGAEIHVRYQGRYAL